MPVKNKIQLCKYAGVLMFGVCIGAFSAKHKKKKGNNVGTIWIGKHDPEEMIFTPNCEVSDLKKCEQAMIDIKIFDN